VFLGSWISMIGSRKLGSLNASPSPKDLAFLKELLQAGQVNPVIDRRYLLSESAEAFRYVGEGHARGKVVITMEHNHK
jgi:NADPH:quinone reductase-like Zn-dependent oxidoreductase